MELPNRGRHDRTKISKRSGLDSREMPEKGNAEQRLLSHLSDSLGYKPSESRFIGSHLAYSLYINDFFALTTVIYTDIALNPSIG